tara:strand:- start:166 stop:351 length:186 start_codon:yes stop_codon:yes gene_type:complete
LCDTVTGDTVTGDACLAGDAGVVGFRALLPGKRNQHGLLPLVAYEQSPTSGAGSTQAEAMK